MRFLHMDAAGNPIGDGQLHDVYKAVRSQDTDGTDTLEITCADTLQVDDLIAYQTRDGLWAEHQVVKADETRADSTAYGTYTCESSLQNIAGKSYNSVQYRGGAATMLTSVLADTPWTVGRVETNGVLNATVEGEDTNAYEMVETIANAFDLEIETTVRPNAAGTRIETRTVSLLARRGSDVGRTFRYGKDLTQVRRTIGGTHPVTRLYVYGKKAQGENGEEGAPAGIESVNNGKPYIDADANLLATWGRIGADGTRQPYENRITYSDTEDPNTLLRLGKAQLTKWATPTVTYEADVVMLGRGGYDADNARVGDTVRIIDPTIGNGLRLEGRILKIETSLLDGPASTVITLGSIIQPITKQNQLIQNTVQQLWQGKDAWDDAATLTGDYLNHVIDGLNRQMNATGGYTYLTPNEGVIVYDKPRDQNPSMAIQIGGGYFRIANERNSDGTWKWRTMGTGAGLVADTLVAGTIRDATGLNSWNLLTGEFRLSSTTHLDEGTLADLASKDYAANLQTEAKNWAKEYANQIGADAEANAAAGDKTTLDSAKADATAKADQALTDAKADATAKANTAEANANAHSDAADKNTLTSSKSYSDTVAEKTLAAAKAFATDQSKSQVDTLEKELTQTYIFNKLTNNGQTQGIALANGLLYLNATYMDVGIIKGGKSYWNLDSGRLYLEDGEIVAAIITGSQLNGDTITGGTVNGTVINGSQFNAGSIRIDGTVGGYSVTTWIDAQGFRITHDNSVIGGIMVDAKGNVMFRAGSIGPDDDNYVTLVDDDALTLYSSGNELFSINGSTSQSAGLMRLEANGVTFLKVGTGASDMNDSTVIWGANGDRSRYFMVGPSATVMSNNYSSIVLSENGWGATYGISLGSTDGLEINVARDVDIMSRGTSSNVVLRNNNGTHGVGLDIHGSALQLRNSENDVRLDLSTNYIAMVAGSKYVQVTRNGVNQTSSIATANLASTAVAETRMISLAAEGVDLDDASSYDTVPVGITELETGQLHDVLRMLADGDTEGAKALLDQYESDQQIWTQKDYDQLNVPPITNRAR